jgi:hypothetical protein
MSGISNFSDGFFIVHPLNRTLQVTPYSTMSLQLVSTILNFVSNEKEGTTTVISYDVGIKCLTLIRHRNFLQ